MSRPSLLLGALLILALSVAGGCHPQQPFYLHEDGDLSHYIGMATDMDVPDLEAETLAEVDGAIRPFSLTNDEPKQIWEPTLQEAVRCALENSKVFRSIGGQVLPVGSGAGMPDFLLRNPDAVQTVYEPAIDESNPRFGVEAALSAFDAQLSTSMFWENFDTPRNTTFDFVGSQRDTGTFQAQIAKTTAVGSTFSLAHNVLYEQSDSFIRRYPSDWNVNLEAEFRQPILQGYGVQFNRIAGPGAIPGFNNGVMLARINTDVRLADFQAQVRDLVADVERAYWDLYLAYRTLDTVVAGRDSALQTWRRINALYVQGARGGEAAEEAQAREQYYRFRTAVEESLNNLYATEAQLRYIMGLAATDGRLIRPADELTNAKVAFDWCDAHAEAITRRVELRRQRWRIKQRELELIAAKNYLQPRLDAVGRYRWLGLGDDMIDSRGGTGDHTLVGSNAYQSMTDGNFQEWQLGIEFSMPIGFRREMAGVRHAQLNLARERAVLQEQELEASHQLAYAVRELEAKYVLSQTNFNRRVAAQRQVEAVQAAYETETVTIDRVLEAQRRLAVAESEFFRSMIDYNKAIADVHLRKGSLLEYNGVYLSEGPWPGKAYFDAHGRARARDASLYLDYGYTRPKVMSRGPYNQQAGTGPAVDGSVFFEGDVPLEAMPEEVEMGPELIPAPQPEPLDALPEPPVAEPQAKQRSTDAPQAARRQLATRVDKAEHAAQPVKPASFDVKILSGTTHEPVANPSPAPTDRPASGWKGVQR